MRKTLVHSHHHNRQAPHAVLLMLLYLLAQQVPWFAHGIAHAHGHHEHTHTAEEEQDPCHRSVYHAGLAGGCDHDAHLSAPETDCHWSFYGLLPYYFSFPSPSADPLTIILAAPSFAHHAVVQSGVSCRFLRGPPAC